MFNKILFVLIVGAALILPQSRPAESAERGNWHIGFGLGAGLDARYREGGNVSTFDEAFEVYDKSPRFAANVKIGTVLTPKTLLGFDYTVRRQEGTLDTILGRIDGFFQISNYFVMLTHFPAGEGVFLRGGGGYSTFVKDASLSGATAQETVNGFGILGGVGYAFRLGESFHLTLNLDHSGQFYSGRSGEPDRSQFTALYVGFDWF